MALGQRAHNGAESLLSGFSAGVVFHLPALCACFAMLSHMDYIAAYGQQVPMLASITEALPKFAWTYTLILLLGIFTTVTGYTWFVTERFTEEGTKANRILCVAVTLVCMVAGSILPFNVILNLVFPVTGVVGMLLAVCIVVKEAAMKFGK